MALVQKLSKLGTGLLEWSKPRAKVAWYYARIELAPPSPYDVVEIKNGFQKLIVGFAKRSWRETTVRDAMINLAVTTEVITWFFIGECIGKGSLIGYHV